MDRTARVFVDLYVPDSLRLSKNDRSETTTLQIGRAVLDAVFRCAVCWKDAVLYEPVSVLEIVFSDQHMEFDVHCMNQTAEPETRFKVRHALHTARLLNAGQI